MAATVTALPTAPDRNDPPTFSARSDALVAALATFVSECNTLASEVSANATAAAASEAAVGASAWVSAASYTAGDVVYSPSDYKAYRAKTTHSGQTTDPSSDSTNWALVSGLGDATVSTAQEFLNKTINLASNTITTTLAELNTAVSDATLVDTTSTQTISGKTITGLILDGGVTEEVAAVADGASVVLDPANGTIQTWTLGANRSPAFTGFDDGQWMALFIDDGTAYTITWPSMQWSGGSAPTLATTGYTAVVLVKISGTVYGGLIGSMS